jgi:type IV pilus modification protein PilV
MQPKRHKKNGLQTEAGFTLIEALLAIAIFSIGILAAASMNVATINGNATARFSNEAAVMAQDQLERLIAMPFDAASPPAELAPGYISPEITAENGRYRVQWQVSNLHDPVNNAVTVIMTANWSDRGRDRSMTYRLVKAPSM